MDETTTTTVFPCPDPDAPFCGLPCDEIANCNTDSPVATTLVEHQTPAAELPHTGAGDLVLAIVALVLILAGAAMNRWANGRPS